MEKLSMKAHIRGKFLQRNMTLFPCGWKEGWKKFRFISMKVMATSSILSCRGERWKIYFSFKKQEVAFMKIPSLHKILLYPIHCNENYRRCRHHHIFPHPIPFMEWIQTEDRARRLSIYQLQIVGTWFDWKTASFHFIRFRFNISFDTYLMCS